MRSMTWFILMIGILMATRHTPDEPGGGSNGRSMYVAITLSSTYFCQQLYGTLGKIFAGIVVRHSRTHLAMCIQMKQALVLISKSFVHIFLKCIFGGLKVRLIKVAFDPMGSQRQRVQKGLNALKHEISALFVRYTRDCTFQRKWRPESVVVLLIIIKCDAKGLSSKRLAVYRQFFRRWCCDILHPCSDLPTKFRRLHNFISKPLQIIIASITFQSIE